MAEAVSHERLEKAPSGAPAGHAWARATNKLSPETNSAGAAFIDVAAGGAWSLGGVWRSYNGYAPDGAGRPPGWRITPRFSSSALARRIVRSPPLEWLVRA